MIIQSTIVQKNKTLITMAQILLTFYVLMTCLVVNVHSQQNYTGLSSQDCDSNNQTGNNSQPYLYACNGEKRFCQAFLIFKSKPPYNSVKTISNLTSSSRKELARVNNVAESQLFPTNKEVIIPVDCSCAGQYYQKNTSIIIGDSQTYYIVANDILQGLSTCNSLMRDNKEGEPDLIAGMELKVPLRCACPTRNQIRNGTKYLLTYPLNSGDSVSDIGERFNVSEKSILYANGFSEDDPNPAIFSSTPILIPLPTEPSSTSLTIIQNSDDDTKAPTFPPLVGSDPRKHKSTRKLYVVIAITAGCSLLVLVVALSVFFLVYKKRPKGLLLPRMGTRRLSPDDLRAEIASFEKGIHVYEIEEIKKATESFSSERQIKGSVFYGVFGKDTTLAVKRTRKDVFKEVNILKKLNHFNLIKLEGVCKYNDRFYQVFEYMENGSLREWLCENCSSEKKWSWAVRIQIALDIAHGLNYLHSFTKPGYVHKNIKSSNILLDGNMRAKIANFGLAGPAMDLETTTTTSTSTDHSQTTTTSHVVGTRGYVDPEYLATGITTPKIDVFAFGVVVLELMTRKNAVAVQNGREVLLSKAVVEIMEGDCPEADLGVFIDPSLKEDNRYREFALRVAKLSVACLKREPESRPSMAEVVSTLSKIQADHLQKIDL